MKKMSKTSLRYKVETRIILFRFRFCKIKNRLADKISRQRRRIIRENGIHEIYEKNINGGCMYYKTKSTPKKFVKGRDLFETYKTEAECLKRLNPKNNQSNYLKKYASILPKTITLEYVDWIDLDRFAKKNAMAKKDGEKLGVFLMEILKDFRKNSIVHRDLRPQNILVMKENNLMRFKVIDFGFAIVEGRDNLDPRRMMDRRVLLTLGEEYRGKDWDDAYSAYMIMKKYAPEFEKWKSSFVDKLIPLCTERTKMVLRGEDNA